MGWLADHTVGWVFDHTVGWTVGRGKKRKDRQLDDLGALADALSEALTACRNIGRGYLTEENDVQKARQLSGNAVALSTRIPDAELGQLTKAASDGIGAFLDDSMHVGRYRYTGPVETAMERIRELRRRPA
jgi:hypothetical protein